MPVTREGGGSPEWLENNDWYRMTTQTCGNSNNKTLLKGAISKKS